MSLDSSKDSNSPNDDFPTNSHPATHSVTTKKTLSQESVTGQSCSFVHGTSLRNDAQTADSKVYFMSNYDRYIQADLENRVSMPANDFFTNILHLPQDWPANDEIQTLITTIKTDPTFRGHVKTYVELRDKSNPKSEEKAFHHPHELIFDGTFGALGATANYRLGLDANPVVSGSQEIPDAWGDNGSENTFSWTQTMHWQEFEPDECHLDEASDAIYGVLMADGKDPRVPSRRKPILRRDPGNILPPTWSYPSSYKRRSEADDASCL
ncbi:hypothetical protein ARMSODRAFT_1017004 [Armillaria solidipes]|uniref:Uncharacterized protein n=1 Tax=Armillaria solidipes TaxID=1076256 RepID=A0A2H3C122_9AGAR|nr:hypothetical protein ARMSODRAFT_1017004 [Armillaria solidipes]